MDGVQRFMRPPREGRNNDNNNDKNNNTMITIGLSPIRGNSSHLNKSRDLTSYNNGVGLSSANSANRTVKHQV